MMPRIVSAPFPFHGRPSFRSLTHFDAQGQAHMVDVGGKTETHRVARATRRDPHAAGDAGPDRAGSAKKGDVLGVARIAAIQAAKRTSELVPLCHPLPITRVAVEFEIEPRQPATCAARRRSRRSAAPASRWRR